jgi:hypothetical protein
MDSTDAYIYGPGTDPIEQVKLGDGPIAYLMADRLGSVRSTINASGALTHSTSYVLIMSGPRGLANRRRVATAYPQLRQSCH